MTQQTVFISDIHLNEHQPAITERFIHFLENNQASIEKLYILGDLFDYWIGDDDHSPLKQSISQALKKCADAGVEIYFIHGNRDYLIGKKFAQSCGMILLNEKTVISLYGKTTLLMHGDLLCTDDHAYQKYRRIMFSPIIKKICVLPPLWLRRKIAKKLRKVSQDSNSIKSMDIMDVSNDSVIGALRESQAELLIHGHTHRQTIHEVSVDGKSAQRIVLGAWENNLGNALIVSETQVPRFINFDQALTFTIPTK